MTAHGQGSVSSPIVISDDEDALFVEQELDGDSWADSWDASNDFVEGSSGKSAVSSVGQKRSWSEMVAASTAPHSLPEWEQDTPVMATAGQSTDVALGHQKASSSRNKKRKKQKLAIQSHVEEAPAPMASALVPEYMGSAILLPLCFSAPSTSNFFLPPLPPPAPTLPPKPSAFTTSIGHSLNTSFTAPQSVPVPREESAPPAPAPVPVTSHASASVVHPVVVKIIGMPADDKHANAKRGMFTSLLKNSSTPDASRALVMELLPRKFREFGFVETWAMQFDEHPVRIELDNRVGKALIEFRTPDAATTAYNSPRIEGGEGREHIRVWWYRPDPSVLPKDLEEGEIQESDGTELQFHGLDSSGLKKKSKSKQQKVLKKKLQDTFTRSKLTSVPLPAPLPPPLPSPLHSLPPAPLPPLSQPVQRYSTWPLVSAISQSPSSAGFPLTGFIPPPSWPEHVPITWSDWAENEPGLVPRAWPSIRSSASGIVDERIHVPLPPYEDGLEEEPMDLETDDGFDERCPPSARAALVRKETVVPPVRQLSPSWSDHGSAEDEFNTCGRKEATDWSESQRFRADVSPSWSDHESAPALVAAHVESPHWSDNQSIASSRPGSPEPYSVVSGDVDEAKIDSVRPRSEVHAPSAIPRVSSSSLGLPQPQPANTQTGRTASAVSPPATAASVELISSARMLPSAYSSYMNDPSPFFTAMPSSNAAILSSNHGIPSGVVALPTSTSVVHAPLRKPAPASLPPKPAAPTRFRGSAKLRYTAFKQGLTKQVSAPALLVSPTPPRSADSGLSKQISSQTQIQSILPNPAPLPVVLPATSTALTPTAAPPFFPPDFYTRSSPWPPSVPAPQAQPVPKFTKLSLLARQKELQERIARTKEELAKKSTSPSVDSNVSPTESLRASGAASPVGRKATFDDLRRLVLANTQNVEPVGACSRAVSESVESEGSDPITRTSSGSSLASEPASPCPTITTTGSAVIRDAASFDELAVTFITETIQQVKPTQLRPAPSSEKIQLAAKQRRLEEHIAESKVLMAQLDTARTKQEKERILGILRARRRAMEEDMKPEPQRSESPTAPPRSCAVQAARVRWPGTARDATVLVISDAEDDDEDDDEA